MATKLWLTITNVRLGTKVEVQIQDDASDGREKTWLGCSQSAPLPDKLYELVLKALQNNRKASGRLTSKRKSKELEITEVRVQYE